MPTPRRKSPAEASIARRRGSKEDGHFYAELPDDLIRHIRPMISDPKLFQADWRPDSLPAMFAKSRSLMRANDFWGGVNYVRLCYFADGIRYENDAMKKWGDKAQRNGLKLNRLELDIWNEFLTCDSAIVFWKEAERGKFAIPVVLDCESCEYSDALGIETLKVRPSKMKLTDQQKAVLGKRWVEALTQGRAITLDPAQGEYFRVLTWGKLGSGLGYPRVGQILDKLSIRELLEIADFGGAWEHGDIFRHVAKGHAIQSGDHAGEPKHFITKAQSVAIRGEMKGKRGPRTAVTNFDVSIAWKFLDPRFFDEKKYDGTVKKLKQWGGAAALIFEEGQVSPNLMSAFATEGRRLRSMVGGFIADLLNDTTFNGGLALPKGGVSVCWNAQSFLDIKMMLEWMRAGYSNGLLSPQTARASMGLDNDTESRLMVEASKQPDAYTPVFEAKQGIVIGKGGRPSDKPGAETQPTSAGD